MSFCRVSWHQKNCWDCGQTIFFNFFFGLKEWKFFFSLKLISKKKWSKVNIKLFKASFYIEVTGSKPVWVFKTFLSFHNFLLLLAEAGFEPLNLGALVDYFKNCDIRAGQIKKECFLSFHNCLPMLVLAGFEPLNLGSWVDCSSSGVTGAGLIKN